MYDRRLTELRAELTVTHQATPSVVIYVVFTFMVIVSDNNGIKNVNIHIANFTKCIIYHSDPSGFETLLNWAIKTIACGQDNVETIGRGVEMQADPDHIIQLADDGLV